MNWQLGKGNDKKGGEGGSILMADWYLDRERERERRGKQCTDTCVHI